jgi:hypothetical protein
LVVDWVDFLQQSIRIGWKLENTLSKIEESFLETKGKEHSDIMMGKLKELVKMFKEVVVR